MKYTQIFIEHFITGIQAMTWIIIFLLTISNIGSLDLNILSGFEEIAVILLIAIAYPLGIFIDNLADKMLKNFEKRIRNTENGSKSMRKLLVQIKDDSLTEYFDYLRTRIRLSRSTAFNFMLITITASIYLVSMPLVSKTNWLLIVILVGSFLTIIAFYSWYSLTKTFAKSINKRYKELDLTNGK